MNTAAPSRHRVLVVEDDLGIVELIRDEVQALGCEVQVAHLGREAMEILERDRPRLILLDFSLPDFNGADLIDRMEQSSQGGMPPFIVMTGMGDERIAVAMMKRGARDYLVKDSHFLAQLPMALGAVLRTLDTEDRLATAEAARRSSEANLRSALELAERLRREAEALAEKANQANRAKSEFLAVISHELRTPLNPILGFSDLLMESLASSEDRDMVRLIHQAGMHLHELIGEILDYTRIESDRVEVQPESLVLGHWLGASLEPLGAQAERTGLRFTVESQGLEEPILADPRILRRILLNLVGNALKFTERGHITVRCLPTPEQESWVRLEVSDTGIGIPKEQQEKIFELFYQVDGSLTRRYGGTGLGLTICQRLCQLLKGSIHVRSEPGIGSTFCVDFPATPAPRPLSTGGASKRPPQRSLPPGLRILVVEDEGSNQAVAQAVLNGAGACPHLVSDGEEALRLLETESFDVIVMDVSLPGKNGIEVTQAIRQIHPQSPPAIVALTANASVTVRDACMAAGMDAFLTKPIYPTRLVETILEFAPRKPEAGK